MVGGMIGLVLGLSLGELVYVLGVLPCVFGGSSCDPGTTVVGIGLLFGLGGIAVSLILTVIRKSVFHSDPKTSHLSRRYSWVSSREHISWPMGLLRTSLTLVLVALMVVSVMALSYGQSGSVYAVVRSQSSPSSGLIVLLEQYIRSLTVHFDSARAITFALASSDFQAGVLAHGARFNSIFQGFSWSVDTGGLLKAQWNSVNVVFSYDDGDGLKSNIVATEDPSLTGPVQVATQQHVPIFFGGGTDNPHWSGDEFSKSWLYQSIPVYEAYGAWTMPAIYQPSQGCLLHYCHFGVWTGLTNAVGGSTGIVQGGSANRIDCTAIGCSYDNWLWYEFYDPNSSNNSSVSCMSVNPGDSVASDVLDTGILNGGPPTHVYNIWVYDHTISRGCWTQGNFSQMGTSYLADFLSERPAGCGSYCGSGGFYRLPIFANPSTGVDTVTITHCGIDLSQSSWYMPCYTPFSQGWYNSYYMVNGPSCRNIYLHGVQPDNSFAQDWQTSCGT